MLQHPANRITLWLCYEHGREEKLFLIACFLTCVMVSIPCLCVLVTGVASYVGNAVNEETKMVV